MATLKTKVSGIEFENPFLLASAPPTAKIESIDKVGSIIVSNKSLLDIIKCMPEDIIKFEVDDGLRIKITSGECEFNLNCLNSLDYPDIDMSDNKTHIDMKAETLKKMIRQTIFAVSTQESRPLLMGINIKINGNVLECTATDSYRLAKKTINLDTPYDEVVDIVIPASNIGELEKIMHFLFKVCSYRSL